jgi:hypothetical protein
VVRAWSDRARIRATLNRIGKHPLVLHDESDISGLILSEEEQSIVDLIRVERLQLADLSDRQLADEETISALIYTLAVTRQFAFKGQKKGPMAAVGSALRTQLASKALTQTAVDPIPVEPPAPAPARTPSNARVPAASPQGAQQAGRQASSQLSPKPPIAAPVAPAASAGAQAKGPMPKLGGPAARPVASGTIQGLQPKALEKMLAAKGQPPAKAPTNGNGPVIGARPAIKPIAGGPAAKAGAGPLRAASGKMPAAAPASAGRIPAAGPVSVGRMPAAPSSEKNTQPAAATGAAPRPGSPVVRPATGAKVPQIRPIAPSVGKMLAAKAAPPPSQRMAVAAPSTNQVTAPRPPAPRPPPPEPEPDLGPSIELDDRGTEPPPEADAEDCTLAFADAGIAEAELAIEAMTNFRLADTALQRSNLVEAERLVLKAVEADPNQPEYRVLLVWVQAMRANNNGAFESAVASISQLIEEDPSNERAFLYRGRFQKKLGFIEQALEDFAAVLDLNPSNREAQAEQRALKKK